MPAKNTKRSTNTKATKSNVAKSSGKTSLLNKKVKFNWKIAAVIGVVLVAALGYLFVRLSSAGKEVPCTRSSIKTNCFYNASDAKGYSGGQIVTKSDGSSSWTGVAGNSITFQDEVMAKIYTDYCFDVSFPGDTNSKWTITWKNKTTNTSKTSSGTTNGGRKIVCVGREIVNGQPVFLTRQEVTFTVAQSSAVVYRLVRKGSEATVSTPSPGTPINSAAPPAPAPQQPGAKDDGSTASTPAPKPPAPQQPQGLCQGLNAFGRGNQGDCVRLIQQRLKDLGYDPGVVDGVYGENTFNAVKVFQQRNGLAQDGTVGTQTWNVLFSANAARKQ